MHAWLPAAVTAATDATFEQEVLKAPANVPVVVAFYMPVAQQSVKSLANVKEVAGSYAEGRVKFVGVNIAYCHCKCRN